MDMRDQVHGPLAARRQQVVRRLAVNGDRRRGWPCRLRHRQGGAQLAEIPAIVGQHNLFHEVADRHRRRGRLPLRPAERGR